MLQTYLIIILKNILALFTCLSAPFQDAFNSLMFFLFAALEDADLRPLKESIKLNCQSMGFGSNTEKVDCITVGVYKKK